MNYSVFGYPGNKASLSPWIIKHLPDHRLYVEVFGGAAGVLANKPPSHNEVYNDIDEDLVQFFDVLRDRPDLFDEPDGPMPFVDSQSQLDAFAAHADGGDSRQDAVGADQEGSR